MTQREKVMLAAMLLGALGGGGFMLFERYQQMVRPQIPGKPPAQVLSELNAKLAAAPLDKGKVAAAVAAQTPLERDFLQPLPRWIEESNKVKNKQHNDLQYTGYLAGTSRTLAIIGNTEYGVGDTIEGTTLRVTAITASHVLLTSGEGEDTELPYQGEELPI